MNTSFRFPCLVAAGLLAAVGIAAAGGSDTAATLFKQMDTDGDGRLSPDEHVAGAKRMFQAMDADRDGKVTAAEMDAAQPRVTGRPPAASDLPAADKIKAVDTDGDGVLTAAEHEAGTRAVFAKMDADRDGRLSREEHAAGHARMLQRPAR
jgi:Ca2+-binding EF-hand superfamily protein